MSDRPRDFEGLFTRISDARVTYSQHLAGTYVCVLADNDGPDKEFAHIKAKNLLGIAKTVKFLLLPNLPDHGDVKDWLDDGHPNRKENFNPGEDGERVQNWKGIKVVNPVNPISHFKGRVREEVNKRLRKKVDQSDKVDQTPSGGIPDYPTAPCPTCGSINFWLTPDNRWLCERCHPKPGSNDNAN